MIEDNNNTLKELTKVLNQQTSGNKKSVENSTEMLDVVKMMAISTRRVEQLTKLSVLDQKKLLNGITALELTTVNQFADLIESIESGGGSTSNSVVNNSFFGPPTSDQVAASQQGQTISDANLSLAVDHLASIRQTLADNLKLDKETSEREINEAKNERRALSGSSEKTWQLNIGSFEANGSGGGSKGGDSKGGGLMDKLGMGAGLAGIGKGLKSSAQGIAMMGMAIPAFFGGLMIGNAALGLATNFDGFDFNFANIKKAAKGFASIVLELDQKSMLVIGGLIGLSAFAGHKAGKGPAMSLALMGLSITSFLGGLALGDAVLGAMGNSDYFDMNFTSMKKAMAGFSSMIVSLDKEALVVMGGLIGLSAFAGQKAGLKVAGSIALMGLSITSFLGGLALGELAIGALGGSGLDLNFPALKNMFAGFSDAIMSLSIPAMAAFGGILALATGASYLKVNPLKMITMMATFGAGIAGFIAGFGIGEYALDKIGATDFTAMKAAIAGFSDSVTEMSDTALVAFAGILGASAVLAAVGTFGTAAKMALAMTGIGAGIGGFFAGFTLGAYALDKIGVVDYTAVKGSITAFGEAVDELSDRALKTMGVLMGAGGILALIGGFGGGPAFALAMTGIGAGIGGFFAGFDGVSKVANKLGLDGNAIADLMENLARGAQAFEGLDMLNLSAGLLALGPALVALLGAEGLASLGDSIKNTLSKLNPLNWFGSKEEAEEDDTGIFGRIAKVLGDPKQLDIDALNDLMGKLDVQKSADFALSLNNITDALKSFGGDKGFWSGLGDTLTSMVSKDPLAPFLKLANRGDDLFRAGIGLEKIMHSVNKEVNPDRDGLERVVQFAKDLGKEQPKLDMASSTLHKIAINMERIGRASPSGNITGLGQESIAQGDLLRREAQTLENNRTEVSAGGSGGGTAVIADNSTSTVSNKVTNYYQDIIEPTHDTTDQMLIYRATR